jgi:hypothetical protein
VLLVFRKDGETRSLATMQFASSFVSPTSFVDFAYSGGAQEYALLSVDRAGGVSEEVIVVVTEEAGGCAQATHASFALSLVVLLFVRRRRQS